MTKDDEIKMLNGYLDKLKFNHPDKKDALEIIGLIRNFSIDIQKTNESLKHFNYQSSPRIDIDDSKELMNEYYNSNLIRKDNWKFNKSVERFKMCVNYLINRLNDSDSSSDV